MVEQPVRPPFAPYHARGRGLRLRGWNRPFAAAEYLRCLDCCLLRPTAQRGSGEELPLTDSSKASRPPCCSGGDAMGFVVVLVQAPEAGARAQVHSCRLLLICWCIAGLDHSKIIYQQSLNPNTLHQRSDSLISPEKVLLSFHHSCISSWLRLTHCPNNTPHKIARKYYSVSCHSRVQSGCWAGRTSW